jgi:hypothetical protein
MRTKSEHKRAQRRIDMAFKSKDGKSFGNRQRQTAYDERKPQHDSKKYSPEKQSGRGESEHSEPDGDEGASDQPIEEVVAQHGPAEKMEISHDHAAAKHTVTSHHGGHTHVAHHGSADEAHMHAAKAAGVMPPEQEQQPAMAGGGGMQQGGIPGM